MHSRQLGIDTDDWLVYQGSQLCSRIMSEITCVRSPLVNQSGGSEKPSDSPQWATSME